MNREAADLWNRALDSLAAADALLDLSPDICASRAYYAAFYAVSALFVLEGQSYRKHSATEAAVHRDLVRAGRWPQPRGKEYSHLFAIRMTGDYGGGKHVSRPEAEQALDEARRILDAVVESCPDLERSPPAPT